MEHENQHKSPYSFLSDLEMAAVFADLNLKLLSGRHIMPDDYRVSKALDRFRDQLAYYYKELYSLKLEHDKKDGESYYYLDFFETGKGRMADPSRYITLTPGHTVVGIVLLNLYYARFFQQKKQLIWQDILKEIMEGDFKEQYQRVFFSHGSSAHTDTEMHTLYRNWKDAIKSFDKLGWVKLFSSKQEELAFEIRPSIHRLEKLYGEELTHFDEFVQRVNLKKFQNESPTD